MLSQIQESVSGMDELETKSGSNFQYIFKKITVGKLKIKKTLTFFSINDIFSLSRMIINYHIAIKLRFGQIILVLLKEN